MQKTMQFSLGLTIAAAALAGCGGATTTNEGGVDPNPGVISQPDFNSMVSRFNTLQTTVDSTPFTPPNSLPTSGSATYKGHAAFSNSTNDPISLISQAELVANFNSSTITGNLTNFQGLNGVIYNGEVMIQGGKINRSGSNGSTIQATLSGTLSDSTGGNSFIGALTGAFSGQNALYTDAEILGTLDSIPLIGNLYTQIPAQIQ